MDTDAMKARDLRQVQMIQDLMIEAKALRAEIAELRAALERIDADWVGEEKTWRTEAIERRDIARAALAKVNSNG